jgi:hypothetical protein
MNYSQGFAKHAANPKWQAVNSDDECPCNTSQRQIHTEPPLMEHALVKPADQQVIAVGAR